MDDGSRELFLIYLCLLFDCVWCLVILRVYLMLHVYFLFNLYTELWCFSHFGVVIDNSCHILCFIVFYLLRNFGHIFFLEFLLLDLNFCASMPSPKERINGYKTLFLQKQTFFRQRGCMKICLSHEQIGIS